LIDDLGLTEITDYYEEIVSGLDCGPIIRGHSFGGLITQLLLDRGLGSAGVAIDSSTVRGVVALPASTLKCGFPVRKYPANCHRSVSLTPDEFHYAFANTLSEAEAVEAYNRYAVPGPGRVVFRLSPQGWCTSR
jgi:hypothetical protein